MSNDDLKPPSNQALLLRLVEDLAEVKAKLNIVADHEERIRSLEKARYQSAWLISVLTAGLSSTLVYFIVKALGA
jgi:hypothetical protein